MGVEDEERWRDLVAWAVRGVLLYMADGGWHTQGEVREHFALVMRKAPAVAEAVVAGIPGVLARLEERGLAFRRHGLRGGPLREGDLWALSVQGLALCERMGEAETGRGEESEGRSEG